MSQQGMALGQILLLSFFFFFFWVTVLPCSPGWPQTNSNPPASGSPVLELQVCATMGGRDCLFWSSMWVPSSFYILNSLKKKTLYGIISPKWSFAGHSLSHQSCCTTRSWLSLHPANRSLGITRLKQLSQWQYRL